MRDDLFRDEQRQHCFDVHIAPINRLVDELRLDGWAPYVAPMYGGINARILSILRDPGPKTQESTGSGFLSWENDDATAETISELFAGAGIEARDVVPWNAYPWFINRKPRARELEQGVGPLKQLLDLLPNLRVVLLLGGSAHDGWSRLVRRFPALEADRGLVVVKTYHTSRQAFRHRDPAVREQRKEHLRRSFLDVARYLTKG